MPDDGMLRTTFDADSGEFRASHTFFKDLARAMATTSLICQFTPEDPKAYNAFQHNSSQMMLLWQPDIMAKAIVIAELDLHCVGAFTMGWDPQETTELELAEQIAGERMRCERLLTIVHAERAKNRRS